MSAHYGVFVVLSQLYEMTDVKEASVMVASALARFNEAFPHKSLCLVLFREATLHVLRVSRILSSPRGHALLLGTCTGI